MRESDLYPPLKRFLESQDYEVKSEIRNCDVMALRGDSDPVIVELKLALNLDVFLQAVDRLALSDAVYIGVPGQCSALRKRRRPVVKMSRMLGLGLLAIDPETQLGSVDVLCDPGAYRPRVVEARRGRLLGEFLHRVGDPNAGGTPARRGIMTAYRQKALGIARYLQANGPTKASAVAAAVGEPKARDVLYRNVYGWFERTSQGIYRLSPRGQREIILW